LKKTQEIVDELKRALGEKVEKEKVLEEELELLR